MADNIYVERIDNALRVMRSVRDEDFQINAWPRCVLGHCALDTWFNDNGFGFRYASGRIPAFDGEVGCLAGAKFFGITLEVSTHIFVASDPERGGAYTTRHPDRKAAIAHLEILRMKKLAESVPGSTIEVTDFVAVDA